ncbi:hypothetical protein D3C84_1161130 [compost metagenome]
MSPVANAPTMVDGITLSRKPITLWSAPAATYCATLEASRVVTSMCMPSPGWTMLTTTRPTSSAIVETISKYSNA